MLLKRYKNVSVRGNYRFLTKRYKQQNSTKSKERPIQFQHRFIKTAIFSNIMAIETVPWQIRKPDHPQTRLKDLEIVCDTEISHIVRYLAEMENIYPTESCWDNINMGEGYIRFVDTSGDFSSYLQDRLSCESGYRQHPTIEDGETDFFLVIQPAYELSDFLCPFLKDQILRKKWQEFFEIVQDYAPSQVFISTQRDTALTPHISPPIGR